MTMRAVLGSSALIGMVVSFGEAFEQLNPFCKFTLLMQRKLALDSLEQPVFLGCPAYLDPFPACSGERQNGLPPILWIRRAAHHSGRLKGGHGSAHRLRAHALSPGEARHRRRSVTLETAEH